MELRRFVKSLTPPFIVDYLKRNSDAGVILSGDYPSWEHAMEFATGYDSDEIITKAHSAALQVKNGEAAFERDTVCFGETQYSWPVLAGLLWVASQNNNHLHILDFGGSLGSSYYQNRGFLTHLSALKWGVVEQEKIYSIGKREFQSDSLKFYRTVEECCSGIGPIHVALLSSVMPYVKDAYSVIQELIDRRIDYLIIDRTAFIEGENDRLTLQKVPKEIYPASYPAWLFSKHKFLSFVQDQGYRVVAEFESFDKANVECEYLGFILERENIQR